MVATPRGEGRSMVSLEPSTIAVSYQFGGTSNASAEGSGWFGPLSPSRPSAPPDVKGRTWDYPTGFNLPFQTRQYEPVGFETLRALADTWDLLRLVLETRKDQMSRMKWSIAPIDEKFKRPGVKIPDALRAKAAFIQEFFQKPDRVTPWSTWLRSLLEDHFVIDAMSIYSERTRGGQLLGLVPMDGGTIKRIIDNWGRTPRPSPGTTLTDDQKALGFQVFEGMIYPPAYQQRLKNLPAVNMTTRDLLYRPQNVRTNKAYGFSRVEQIIMTVNIALRRQMFTLQHYTEGNIPEAIAGVPEAWNPNQIEAFQTYWDQTFAGGDVMAMRRRMKFVPGGMAKTFITTKEPELKNLFDEWLARVVCFCLSVSPQPFVAQVNRATAETAKDSADEEGVESTKEFIATTINEIIQSELKETDVGFAWHEEQHIDPAKQQEILTGFTKGGVLTLNEAREDLGREAYPNPEASQPMVLIATGYVPLSAYQEGQDRAQAIIDAGGGTGPDGGPSGNGPPSKDGKGNPDDNSGPSGSGRKPPANAKGKDALGKLFDKKSTASRRLAPIPFARRVTRTAQAGIREAFVKAFDDLSTSVASQLRDAEKVAKAKKDKSNSEIADEMADDLDLSELDQVSSDVIAEIENVRADTATRALVQLGADNEKLVDQVNEDAATYAREQSATLVSNVTNSTRKMIRDTIADGLEENIGLDEIIKNLQDGTTFSEDRADLIARTEVTDANSEAAVDGYRTARDEAGVEVGKAWILGPNPCAICQENADAGAIDLDEEFPSGDDAPSAHPWCECAVSPVVQ